MALEDCRECKKQVSTKEDTCPHCGISKSIEIKKENSKIANAVIYISIFIIALVTYLSWNSPETDKASDLGLEGQEASSYNESATACKKSWKDCISTQQIIEENSEVSIAANIACQSAVKEKSKYDVEFNFISFSRYLTRNFKEQNNQITLIDEEVKIQNAFGTFEKTKIKCIYDIERSSVVDLNILS